MVASWLKSPLGYHRRGRGQGDAVVGFEGAGEFAGRGVNDFFRRSSPLVGMSEPPDATSENPLCVSRGRSHWTRMVRARESSSGGRLDAPEGFALGGFFFLGGVGDAPRTRSRRGCGWPPFPSPRAWTPAANHAQLARQTAGMPVLPAANAVRSYAPVPSRKHLFTAETRRTQRKCRSQNTDLVHRLHRFSRIGKRGCGENTIEANGVLPSQIRGSGGASLSGGTALPEAQVLGLCGEDGFHA